MNKIILLAISLLMFRPTTSGQVTFRKMIFNTFSTPVDARVVREVSSGGYILAAGGTQIGLTKTDSVGNVLWSILYADPSNFNYFTRSLEETNDKGYIISGYRYNNLMGDEIFLLKTDSNGTIHWMNLIGEILINERGGYVQQTTDGGYITVGSRRPISGHEDIYVVKTNSSGNVTWTAKIGSSNADERAKSIRQTVDGGYIIAGETTDLTSNKIDILLIKLNVSGTVQWIKVFGGSQSNEEVYSILQTTDGGYLLGGNSDSLSAQYNDGYILKTDSIGNLQWSKTYNATDDEHIYSLQQTTDGGFIVSGDFGVSSSPFHDMFLAKIDTSGNIVWGKKVPAEPGSYISGKSIYQTLDSGYIIAGRNYLVKTASDGSICEQSNSISITVSTPITNVNNVNLDVSTGGQSTATSPTIFTGWV